MLGAVVSLDTAKAQCAIGFFIAVGIFAVFHAIKRVLKKREERALSLSVKEIASDE
jgi:hypothetical protein